MDAAVNPTSAAGATAWHALTVDDVLKRLTTSTEKGLDNSEASTRLQKYGPNRLPEGKKRGPFMRFLAQLNNILVYGTAGLAFGDLEANVLGFKESHIGFGWTAGLGLELGLTQNWSVRAEYLYVGLGSNNFGITGRSHDLDSNVFRMGVNYRF